MKTDQMESPLGAIERVNGLAVVCFQDKTGMSFCLSEAAGGIVSGKPAVWLGTGPSGGMLLDRELATKLAQALHNWNETGKFVSL